MPKAPAVELSQLVRSSDLVSGPNLGGFSWCSRGVQGSEGAYGAWGRASVGWRWVRRVGRPANCGDGEPGGAYGRTG